MRDIKLNTAELEYNRGRTNWNTHNMAAASLFLQLALCLLAWQSGEAVPVKPTYADCPIGEPLDKGTINSDGSIPEASGLAYSRRQDGVLWTFNDSGGENKIYAISEQGDRGSIQLIKNASENSFVPTPHLEAKFFKRTSRDLS